MVLFIGHSSAIRLLRSLEDFEGIRSARAMPSLKDVPTLPKSFRESSSLATLPRPLEVVVLSGKTRSQSKRFHNNIWKLPDRAPCFLSFESGIYLSNPEFCFVQLARSCSVIDLIKLGFELCGTYRIDPASSTGFRPAQPLFEHRGDQSLYRQNAWQSASESKNSYSLCLRRFGIADGNMFGAIAGPARSLWRLRIRHAGDEC